MEPTDRRSLVDRSMLSLMRVSLNRVIASCMFLDAVGWVATVVFTAINCGLVLWSALIPARKADTCDCPSMLVLNLSKS